MQPTCNLYVDTTISLPQLLLSLHLPKVLGNGFELGAFKSAPW